MNLISEDYTKLDKIVFGLNKNQLQTVPEILNGYNKFPSFDAVEATLYKLYEDVLIQHEIVSVQEGWTENSVVGGFKALQLEHNGRRIVQSGLSTQDFISATIDNMDQKDYIILGYLAKFNEPIEIKQQEVPPGFRANILFNGSGPDTLHARLHQLGNRGFVKHPDARSHVLTEAGRIEWRRYKAAQPKPSFASLMDKVARFITLPENKGQDYSEQQLSENLGLDREVVEAIHAKLLERKFIDSHKTNGTEGNAFHVKDSLKAFVLETSFEEEKNTRISRSNSYNNSTPDQGNSVSELAKFIAAFRKDYPPEQKTAFIIMQFGSTRVHSTLVTVIKETLKKHNVIGLRADDKEYSDDLFSNIRTYMHCSDFGIAIFERVTEDNFNPNVSLEAGYMMGLGKSLCLLKDQTLKNLHTDLIGKLYKSFDPLEIEKTLPLQLERWLTDKSFI